MRLTPRRSDNKKVLQNEISGLETSIDEAKAEIEALDDGIRVLDKDTLTEYTGPHPKDDETNFIENGGVEVVKNAF